MRIDWFSTWLVFTTSVAVITPNVTVSAAKPRRIRADSVRMGPEPDVNPRDSRTQSAAGSAAASRVYSALARGTLMRARSMGSLGLGLLLVAALSSAAAAKPKIAILGLEVIGSLDPEQV